MKFFVVLSAFVALCTLSGCHHHEIIVEREEPAPPPPDVVVIEDGAPVEGVVFVQPPVVEEYVFIGGRYCYWHPGYHRWVEMRRGWRPGRGCHVRNLRSWHDRPMHEGDHRGPGRAEDHRSPGRGEDVHRQPGVKPGPNGPHAGPLNGPPTAANAKKLPAKKPTGKQPPGKKPAKEEEKK
jgi:hypothetical protein